ncbi:MAG: DoxX family membrane protein [Propionibacteriaceae bacterium]|nr:DoxX family membrane protein [Propionibacteriaceae bacterium]
MKALLAKHSWQQWLSLLARLILGVVLIVAGLTKIGNLNGAASAAAAYHILPYDLAQVVGMALPFAEIGLGLLLVIGLFTRLAGVLGALLMLAFIIAIASVWARGISIDCGCFGSGGPLDPAEAVAKYPWEIARDIALTACGVWLAGWGKHLWSVDAVLFRPITVESLATATRSTRRK